MKGEHGSALLLLLVQLVRVELPLPDWKWFRLIPRQVLRHRLHVEEDRLLCHTIVVLGGDDELATVLDLASVDDEGVVIADVPLHELDALLELDVVMVPGNGASRQTDDAASESGTVAFQSKGGLGLDDKAGCGALPVDQDLLHPVLLHLQLPQG